MGYHVEHVTWERHEGGGLATLIPHQVWVLATSSMELYIHTAIATEGGAGTASDKHVHPPYPAPACA